MSWRILVFPGGTYRLRLHVMAPSRATRHVYVSTTEGSYRIIVPQATGQTWASEATVDLVVELSAGFNTVTVGIAEQDSGSVDLDYVELFDYDPQQQTD